MKVRIVHLFCVVSGIAVGALGLAFTASAAPDKAAAPATVVTNTTIEIPQSLFIVPRSPKEGRNPFFPNSTMGVELPPPPKDAPVDTSAFTLNGITSPPKLTAMINGRTFEVGEEGEVRLPMGGKALIKCEEIKTASAVILINGQRRELRMRTGVL